MICPMEKLSKYMLRGRVVKGSVVRGRIDVEPSMTDTNCLKCHESFYSMLLSFPVSCFWESFASFRFRSRKKEKTGRRLLLQKHSCIITYADKRGETSEDSSWRQSRKRRSSSGLFLSWDSKKSLPSRLLNIFFKSQSFFSLRINLVFLPKYLAQMSLGPFLYILMSSYLSFIEIKCSPCTAVCSVLKALSQTRVRIQRIQLFS